MTGRAADLAKAAARAVDADLVLHLARSLVRIDSVVRPATGGGEAACVAWLDAYLREQGLAPVVHEVLPGRPNLVADVTFAGRPAGGRRRRRLLLEGHTDVVTEGDLTLWTRDPFGARVEDGRLYGRGACDMKGGLAAALAALEALRRAAPELPGDIRLACLADEEGMMRGVKRFIEQGLARDVDGAIVCEPEQLELCLVQKGAMRVVVDLAGRMAHGAMPYAGASPIPAAAEVVRGAVRLDAEIRARMGTHAYLGTPHVTPTILAAPPAGEAQLNVVPARARVGLDVRTIPGQDHRALQRDLEALAAEASAAWPGVSAEVTVVDDRPVVETPPDARVVRALEAACPIALGRAPRYGGVPGSTDGTFLAAWAGVPVVVVGPGTRTVPHQADEWVGVDDLVASARLYAAAAVLFLMDDEPGRHDP